VECDLVHEFDRNAFTVDRERLIPVRDTVTGDTDHALDEVTRLVRRDEHHDIAALRLTDVEDLRPDHGQTNTVGVFVDENEVADLERGHHRFGRNPIWLRGESAEARAATTDRGKGG